MLLCDFMAWKVIISILRKESDVTAIMQITHESQCETNCNTYGNIRFHEQFTKIELHATLNRKSYALDFPLERTI
jgi:hypothetical protein